MQPGERGNVWESSSTIAIMSDNGGSKQSNPKLRKFGLMLIGAQLAFIALFAVFVQYDWDALPVSLRSLSHQPSRTYRATHNDTAELTAVGLDPRLQQVKYPLRDYFSMYGDIQIMIFLAFGLFIACFKRYGYSATGMAFMLCAFIVQWSTLVHGFFHLTPDNTINLSLITLISADFTIAAVLISTCVLLGTLSPLQYIVLALIEVVVYAGNEWLCLSVLRVVDVGGAIYLHTFAAYFGLAVAFVLNRRTKECLKSLKGLTASSYFNELLAFLGTILLFIYWPSFNSVFAPADLQQRAVINTALALLASSLATFAMSAIVFKEKFSMTVIQNGALAGGVAIGSTADLMIQPYAALMIGFAAGTLTVIGFKFIAPVLEERWKLLDMCGVQYLHGLPGLFAGLVSALVCGIAKDETYGSSYWEAFPAAVPPDNSSAYQKLLVEYPALKPGFGRTPWMQAGFQVLALLVSVLIAMVSGLVTGLLLKLSVFDPIKPAEMLCDDELWLMPKELSEDQEASVRETLEQVQKMLDSQRQKLAFKPTIVRNDLNGLQPCLKVRA
ncbi:hypothetical protein RvY_03840 [Ramazzottius varieornatus]|uniref:Ammonium transporter AmtB-like domain-containing protein n=1 Tax=Ramazzottius varieornatus TaxID=947166 RepID=A0A1D1UWJ0_RAMVA|nr:hypothetical protein RvY_03840 [Ramazzottius varieornatus]